jgi:uncharacterized cofD-like protein
VALGGGHGLANSLCALAGWSGALTAVVSVADDGGSSGRLRAMWNGPAPGDVRRCLLALASEDPRAQVWAKALDYRFTDGELAGHSLGNLVLMALSETAGDFAAAAAEVARLLGASGQVLPASAVPVRLCAQVAGPEGPSRVVGQARIAHSGPGVQRIWLEPPMPAAYPGSVEAVAAADLVVLGPGSLYTSVLAVCAVPGLGQALSARPGGRVYVCNLSPQEGETEGYDADAHLEALADHGVVVDVVVCDPTGKVGLPSAAALAAVGDGRPAQLVEADVARANGHTHDPARLGAALQGLA